MRLRFRYQLTPKLHARCRLIATAGSADEAHWIRAGRFLGGLRCFFTLLNPNWWYLGMAGRLPEFLCPRECVGQQDYVALDYYWGMAAFRLGGFFRLLDAMQQKFGKAPIWPRGRRRMQERIHPP